MTTVAYLVTQALGARGHDAVWPILVVWVVAMAPPVWMSVAVGRRSGGLGRLSAVWVGLVVFGMAENLWAAGWASEAVKHVSFRPLWLGVGAVGFAATATWVGDSDRRAVYAMWAVLNAFLAVGLVLRPESFEGWTFLLAAIVQGLPMLFDLPLRSREHTTPTVPPVPTPGRLRLWLASPSSA